MRLNNLAPWAQSLVLEGRVFHASFATQTTPISFTAYDQDRPDITVSCPDGAAIIPLYVKIELEDSAGTDTEAVFFITDVAVGAGTSTAITNGPHNMRSDISTRTSVATCVRTHTANITLTNYRELDRWVYAFADATAGPAKIIEYNPLALNGLAPVINGPGTFCVAVAATTTQAAGFAQVYWAEFAEGELR